MLMRDPSYLKPRSPCMKNIENVENELSPLVSKQHSQARPSVLKKHPHSKTEGNEESEIAPLAAGDVSMAVPPDGKSAELKSPGHGRDRLNVTPNDTEKCCSLWDQFGLFLLTDWKFVMFLVCVTMTNLSHVSLHWFIPDRAIEIGLSNHDAAMAITVVNVANILSRLFFGTTSSNNCLRRVIILCVYVFISGLNSILVFLWTTYWTYMIFSGFYGLLRGLFVIYVLLVIVDIVGKDQVSLGLGLLHTFTGIIFLISIPVFGYLNEVTESYVMTFILYGSLEILGGLFLVAIPIDACWKYFKNERYVSLLP